MTELDDELLDNSEVQDEEDTSSESPNESTPEELEELRKKNQWLYDRAKKAEAKLKKQKGEPRSPKKTQEFDIEDIVDLRVQGYSKEEVEKAKAIARGQGLTLSEVVSDPFYQAGVEAMRTKKDTEEATPAPSNKPAPTGTPQKKSWAEMTPEERKASFGSHRQQFAKRGRGSNE